MMLKILLSRVRYVVIDEADTMLDEKNGQILHYYLPPFPFPFQSSASHPYRIFRRSMRMFAWCVQARGSPIEGVEGGEGSQGAGQPHQVA